MARQLGIIADRAIIPDDTVMAHMSISKNPAIVAYYCFHPVRSAPVNGYKFPYCAIVANLNGRSLAIKFSVLGNSSEDSTWKNPAVFTDPRPFHNSDVRTYPCTLPNLDVLS